MSRTSCAVLFIVWVLGSGCSGSSSPSDTGSERGACYPNNTCNQGLTCLSGVCVSMPGADAGGDPGSDGLVPLDRSVADSSSDTAPPPLVWHACDTTDWPAEFPKPVAGVECTTIDVPFDYIQPAGKTFSLQVGRQKSKFFPTGKAVFQLAGGPGGSSVTQSGIIPLYMPKLLNSFDLIYVDRRGTGGSGYLDCSAGYPQTKQEYIKCAAEHTDKDLNHYLTVDAAHELEAVRRALGYDKIYLRGGSYGTRLGLEYLRQHESSIASVVLDGLDTPDWDFFGQMTVKIDQGIALLVQSCAKDASCTALVPDLAGDLKKRRDALHAAPRKILAGGQPYLEDEEMYVTALGALLADDYWRFSVPRAIHQAVQGDNAQWDKLLSDLFGTSITDGASDPAPKSKAPAVILPLRLQPRFFRGARSYVAPGIYIAVTCAENWPNAPGVAGLTALGAKQVWGPYEANSMIDLGEACSSWNVTPLEGTLRQPVQSSVKVLLLSGGIDIITPPSVADQAAKTLSHATHLIFPETTHSIMRIPCAGQIISDFFAAEGEMTKVDTSCLKSLPAPAW
jgi:pimeloyl-ACP methyl ester carboxylesterase